MKTVNCIRYGICLLVAGVAMVVSGSSLARDGGSSPLPSSEPLVLTVRADRPGHPLNKTQYGVFFEEISYAGDGGLYAELVKNRSFEDSTTSIPDWTIHKNGGADGAMSLETADLLNAAQSQSLKIHVAIPGTVGVANNGYWGINVVKGRTYELSFFAKSKLPTNAFLVAKLQDRKGEKTYASCSFNKLAEHWKKYSGQLIAADSDPQGRLVLEWTTDRPGDLWLDVVSLFPPTWKGRPNGARPELAEMVAKMKPAVIRFPGGSYVSSPIPLDAPKPLRELGPIEDRPGHPAPGKVNPWGYRCSDGFGLHEYLQFAEDLGAEPIYVFSGGAGAGSEHGKPGTFLAGAGLEQLIGECLSVIEYANGSANTTWGTKRAANGHPKPFHMKYVQIGNENWHQPFHENYVKMYSAIKNKYPDIQVIWGGDWIGNNDFGYKSGIMPEGSAAEIVDEHYYKGDNWFFANFDRFSPKNYPRGVAREAKVFLGEVSAVQDNLGGALKETAFLLGAEKYSDKVVMAVYAPLLANVNFKKWPANAIYFDSSRVFGTPSYYSQTMLANNVGDVNIAVGGLDGLLNRTLFVNANLVQASGEVILKIVNSDAAPRDIQIDLEGITKLPSSGCAIVLSGSSMNAGNSFETPLQVAPIETKLDRVGKSFPYTVAAYSFTILRLLP